MPYKLKSAVRSEQITTSGVEPVRVEGSRESIRGISRRRTRLRAPSGRSRRSVPSAARTSNAQQGRRVAPEEQLVEVGATVGIDANEPAVENRLVAADAVRHLLAEPIPLREDVAAVGDEPAAIAVDDREGAESVVLDFIEPVGMIERPRDGDERHSTGNDTTGQLTVRWPRPAAGRFPRNLTPGWALPFPERSVVWMSTKSEFPATNSGE